MQNKREAFIVGGLGYGDEGKGTMVDYLARVKKVSLIVRYNGGAQAGHNVITPEGQHHVFSQFGSGTFVPNTKTFLSRFMVVNPLAMMREGAHLQALGINDAFERMIIDDRALITTPFQIVVNRILETRRGSNKHGSCGIGVGQTIQDYAQYGDKVLFAGDLLNINVVRKKLAFIKEKSWNVIFNKIGDLLQIELYRNGWGWFQGEDRIEKLAEELFAFASLVKIVNQDHFIELVDENPVIIFEGAQGILLDKNYGFAPHITKTNITLDNAYTLLKEADYSGLIANLGIIRAFMTRHGAGPLVTEDIGLNNFLSDFYNIDNEWQNKLRFGWFDLLAVNYGLLINDKIDRVALTNLDQLSRLDKIKVCVSYEYEGDLNCLDLYFLWEKIGKNKAKILGFRKSDAELIGGGELAETLFKCKPLDFVEFIGWQKDISAIKSFNDLPKEAKIYIGFLEKMIGVPIRIISVGPTYQGKFYRPQK